MHNIINRKEDAQLPDDGSAQERKVLEEDLKAAGELLQDKEVANSSKKQVKSTKVPYKSRHTTDLSTTSSDDKSGKIETYRQAL